MSPRRRYRKRSDQFITAVQLDLDTEGFTYQKWGGPQVCKRGDWLVDNHGDKYTVSRDSFASTYREVSPGVYVKAAPVWAEIAERPGKIRTQEGETEYDAGDYLVFNDERGVDAYAVSAEKFEAMYELDESAGQRTERP